jgi:hypothetical protein
LLRRFAELELHTMHTQESRQVGTWVPFKSTRVQFVSKNLVLMLLFCELRIAGLTVVKLLYPGLVCFCIPVSQDGFRYATQIIGLSATSYGTFAVLAQT